MNNSFVLLDSNADSNAELVPCHDAYFSSVMQSLQHLSYSLPDVPMISNAMRGVIAATSAVVGVVCLAGWLIQSKLRR